MMEFEETEFGTVIRGLKDALLPRGGRGDMEKIILVKTFERYIKVNNNNKNAYRPDLIEELYRVEDVDARIAELEEACTSLHDEKVDLQVNEAKLNQRISELETDSEALRAKVRRLVEASKTAQYNLELAYGNDDASVTFIKQAIAEMKNAL